MFTIWIESRLERASSLFFFFLIPAHSSCILTTRHALLAPQHQHILWAQLDSWCSMLRRNMCKSLCLLTRSHLGTLDTNWAPWHPSINPARFSSTQMTDSRTNRLTWNRKAKLTADGTGSQNRYKKPTAMQIPFPISRLSPSKQFLKLPRTSLKCPWASNLEPDQS